MENNQSQGGLGTAVDHRPLMSDERLGQVLELRRTLASDGSEPAGEETVSFNGLTLKVPSQVMTPCPVSHMLGKKILAEVTESDRVLDMGAGSGSLGILAATRAARVFAVDINPHAVEAARANAASNGVADRYEVRQSDVFSAVEGTFDLIIFNPPFQWFAARDVADSATTDENYGALTTFFKQVREHLAENGRMIIFFSTMGDVNYLLKLIDEAGFHREVVLEHTAPVADVPVDFAAYRLS
ncbi:HemK2/MTQ2 family protein methyltransferase [Streptomyces sp. TS71-3]|uniref:HemK2/MTQ2 family protein methyltransferase n=1 Tax=Streptomyces sp. TS71-3 TaxID=2733862 RepID=UPI001B2B27CD|nr:HemK2/MTQ2 family protein methyltransferase [Streptomyces sp. TS71-3]GHJ40698.1 hypothetical protein Sm713_63070 [Streptomyces sp. TS71-3]